MSPEGAAVIDLSGSPPAQFRPYFDLYKLDVSVDLRDWRMLGSILRTNSSTAALRYIDPEAAGPSRFYRTFTNHFITPLPRPGGSYGVGERSLLLTDPSRTNRYNIRTNGSFMITLWYPAQTPTGGGPAPYLEPKLAASFGNLYGLSPGVISNFVSHSYLEAEPILAETGWPVVVYSHGFRVGRRDNTARCEELASHGYVVVGIDHADALATVFPDGALHSTTISSLSASLFANDIADVRFVLKTLPEMNESDAFFKGTMDLQRVATMGWSYGGGVAGEICRTDSRVLACVFLEAYFQNAHDLVWEGLNKPSLGTYNPSGLGDTAVFDLATHDAYWMQITGTEHQHFADWLAWLSSPTQKGRNAAGAITACALSFLDKYLKGRDDHLLDDPSAVHPEVINFAKK